MPLSWGPCQKLVVAREIDVLVGDSMAHFTQHPELEA